MKSSLIFILTFSLVFMSNSIHAQFLQNKVIAHRGAWKADKLPQNSIASLQKAIALGCEGSEFDVWMTADGVLVANHDAELEGMAIEENTYSDLLGIKLPNGEVLPRVEDYLREGMKQNKTKLIFEIKSSEVSKERTLELTEKSVELVQELGAEAWVDYISFDLDACKKIVEMDGNARVAYLSGDLNPQQAKDAGFWGLDYHFKVFQQNPEWIKEAQDLGLTLNSWTVNDKKVMQWLLEQGFDFITTDQPQQLLDMIKKEY